MRTGRFTKSRVLLFTSFTLFCALPLIAQQTKDPPQPQVHQIRVIEYSGDFRAFLAHMPRSYDVSIGLEVDPTQPHSSVTVSLQHPTIDDVLAAAIKSRPTYAWRRDGRFVDVYPIKGSTPFLDTTVNSYRVYQVTQSQAIYLLFNQPEVKAAMTNLNLASTALRPDAGGKAFSLDSNGLSIRQLLHQIATASGAGTWIFRQQNGPRHELFTIEMVEK